MHAHDARPGQRVRWTVRVGKGSTTRTRLARVLFKGPERDRLYLELDDTKDVVHAHAANVWPLPPSVVARLDQGGTP